MNVRGVNVKIMIVDDSTQIRTVIKRYVSSHKSFNGQCEILTANNGEQALKTLQQEHLSSPVDIIFLDWHMPLMDGKTFLQSVRSTEVFSLQPEVVMLSAETYPEMIEQCLKLGISSYLTKPFTEEDIHLAIDKILNKKTEVRHAV